MKTAKEYAYEYFAPDAPDELDIDIIKCILSDHDQELIKEIEKKMEKEAQQKSKQNRVFHQGRYDLLTEIINLIKEK